MSQSAYLQPTQTSAPTVGDWMSVNAWGLRLSQWLIINDYDDVNALATYSAVAVNVNVASETSEQLWDIKGVP